MSVAYFILQNKQEFLGEMFGTKGTKVGTLVQIQAKNLVASITDPKYWGTILWIPLEDVTNISVFTESDRAQAQGIIFSGTRGQWEDAKNKLHTALAPLGILCWYGGEEFQPPLGGRVLITSETSKKYREIMQERLVSEIADVPDYTSYESHGKKLSCDYPLNTVGLIDFGASKSFLQEVSSFGMEIVLLSPMTSWEEIETFSFEGLLFSDGPAQAKQIPEMQSKWEGVKNTPLPVMGVGVGAEILQEIGVEPLGLDEFVMKMNPHAFEEMTEE